MASEEGHQDDGQNTLRGMITAVLTEAPELADRCNVDTMLDKMNDFGITSIDVLHAILADTSGMVPLLVTSLTDACPPAVVGLLKAHVEEWDVSDVGGARPDPAAGTSVDAPPRLSSQLRRFLSGLRGCALEFMVPPDHMPWYKDHWIESRSDSGERLKEELLFLGEMELLFGSLIFGALVSVYFSGIINEEVVQAFQDRRYGSFEYWTCVSGAIVCICSLLQLGFAYVTLFVLMPVHPNNFVDFARTSTLKGFLQAGSICIVLVFYTLTTFLCLAICSLLGGSLVAFVITFGIMFGVLFPPFIALSGNCINLAMWSGVYGRRRVLASVDTRSATSAEVDTLLCRAALANCRQHGKPIPATALYEEDRDYGGGDMGGIGRRARKKKKQPSVATKSIAMKVF